MNRITESEIIILNLLWEKGELTILQIESELKDSCDWSKQSVIGYLKRMEKKKAVTYKTVGRTKYYRASVTKDEIAKSEANNLLDNFFGGNIGALVSCMAKENKISDKDMDELWETFRKLKEDNK